MTDQSPLTGQQLDEYEAAARNAARIGSGIDPAAVLELVAEVRRLRAQSRFLIGQLAKKDAASGAGDKALREFLAADPDDETAELSSGSRQCGHDDYHDPHEWSDRPGVWCPGISHADDVPAAGVVAVAAAHDKDGGQ